MKKLPLVLIVALLFACNNGPAKEEQKADTTAVAPAPAEVKPAFVPFKVVVVQHKVKNFGKAETEYFNRDSLRNTYGITHYVIGRDVKDSNTVFVVDKIEESLLCPARRKGNHEEGRCNESSRIYIRRIRDRQRKSCAIPRRSGSHPSCKRFRYLDENIRCRRGFCKKGQWLNNTRYRP